MQGGILWFVALPLLVAVQAAHPAALTVADGLGVLLFAVGFSFEVVGDRQLRRFRADPSNRGQVLDRGLWRYTRHPNYFGDAALWRGLYVIAAATPNGWLTVLSPVLMTVLLMRVSGVTLLEQSLTRLVQVLANILHNASKFMDPGGRIHLKVTREASHVVISVSDSGIGIPQELLHKIFDLFTQVHSKAERGQTGLGIGLALVRRLTEMHGGAVTARSEGPGRGTEFTVRLPALTTEKVARSQASAAETIPVIEPRRILVADDNHDAAESLALQLKLAGHEVRTVHDGAEALSVAKTFKPHIVVLDLGMPKMDGYETARKMRLRSWGKNATLIALTGWGQQQDRQRTTEAGFDAPLVKPVSESQLFQALASAGRKKPIGDVAEAG